MQSDHEEHQVNLRGVQKDMNRGKELPFLLLTMSPKTMLELAQ